MIDSPNPEQSSNGNGAFYEVANDDIVLSDLLTEIDRAENAEMTIGAGTNQERRQKYIDTLQGSIKEREDFLRSAWNEIQGDVTAFHMLVSYRDWQRVAEDAFDPELKQKAGGEVEAAKQRLNSYRDEMGLWPAAE
jgi:hypothetical protein